MRSSSDRPALRADGLAVVRARRPRLRSPRESGCSPRARLADEMHTQDMTETRAMRNQRAMRDVRAIREGVRGIRDLREMRATGDRHGMRGGRDGHGMRSEMHAMREMRGEYGEHGRRMPAGMVVLIVWSLAWKAASLWRAAKDDSKPWFATLFVANTGGILDALYIFKFSPNAKKSSFEIIDDEYPEQTHTQET